MASSELQSIFVIQELQLLPVHSSHTIQPYPQSLQLTAAPQGQVQDQKMWEGVGGGGRAELVSLNIALSIR
jgi:hypothetical protein